MDTNVVSALWPGEASTSTVLVSLGEAKQAGAVLISGIVYAELLAYPGATEVFLRRFLEPTGMVLDLSSDDDVWLEAGRRFSRYADRRRKTTGEGPRRLLADFLIGAHALLQSDRLLTLDPSRYRQDFPELSL